ncbi:MAG: hypothetical protein KC431_27450, partial [Myxococcales bacterium]|nr:hypothetical protein [Myxococcales bacterium]
MRDTAAETNRRSWRGALLAVGAMTACRPTPASDDNDDAADMSVDADGSSTNSTSTSEGDSDSGHVDTP